MAEYFPIDVNGTGNYYGNFYGNLTGTASYAISASWAPGGVGGTPGGSDTYVQYNSGGSFGGDANFTYDYTNFIVTINGDLSVTDKIDTINRYLIDSSTAVSIDWESRVLYSPGGNASLGFDNNIFTYSDFYHASIKSKADAQESFSTNSSSFAGNIIEVTLDNSVATSDLVYLESSDGKWYKVNQTNTTSTKMLGVCVVVSKAGSGNVLLEGHVTVNDNNNGVGPYVDGVDHGLPIYIKSGSTGMMTTTTPASGYIRLLGHAYYNNTSATHQWIMKFKPDNIWTKI